MLQTIREKLSGWAAAVILGLIALTLVVTFGNIDTGFTPAGTAFSVNGEDVPVSEFRAVYQQQKQQWEANFRAQLPDELAESMARSVIDGLVRNKLITQYVDSQGYRVTDAELIDSIRGNPAFQVGGRFSQPAYEQLLNSQGFSPQRFEYDQRRSMEMRQYVEGVAYTAFYTPAEFRRYIALDGETRDVEYLLVPAMTWAKDVSVSADAIAARYEQDKSLYQSTETVSIEYVEVDYNDLLNSVKVDDDELRRYFDDNPQEFRAPDDREVSHILIAGGDEAARAKIQQVRDELVAGASFESLAAKYSDDSASAAKGGSLGWLGLGDAPAQEFEDAMLALTEPGQVSLPVKTEFGYHLIRLDALREGSNLEFADVADDLRTRLREDRAADRYAEILDELDERALESLDGLAPVAEAMGLKLLKVDGFSRNGGGSLGFDPALVDAAFSLEVLEDGENSPVITLEDGRAIVLRVTAHQPSVVKPLEAVQDEIRAVLQQEQAVALGTAAVSSLVEQLNGGAPANKVLPAGQDFAAASALRRGDTSLPAELVAEIFRAPKPAAQATAFASKLLASGDFAVFRVTAALPGRPDNFSQQDRDTRKQQLSLRLGNQQINTVVETLMVDAEVQVTPDLLESTLGTSP